MTEYIYMLQEREFIKTKENIYKIGKTSQPNLKRIQNYYNGTILLFQKYCNNSTDIEKHILKYFSKKIYIKKRYW